MRPPCCCLPCLFCRLPFILPSWPRCLPLPFLFILQNQRSDVGERLRLIIEMEGRERENHSKSKTALQRWERGWWVEKCDKQTHEMEKDRSVNQRSWFQGYGVNFSLTASRSVVMESWDGRSTNMLSHTQRGEDGEKRKNKVCCSKGSRFCCGSWWKDKCL